MKTIVEVPDSNQARSNAQSVDIHKYVTQLEKRVLEQEQLIALLNDKISGLGSRSEPPESPSDLKTVLVTSRAINVQWHHASVNSAEVSHFIVQHKAGSDGSWKQVELNGQLRGCLLEDLKPATRYMIRVFAEGRAGRSLPSEPLVVITEPQQPAGPPLNVVARAVSSTQLLVTWSPPVQELRNGDVQGYNLGFIETSSVNSGAGAYNMTGLVGDGAEEGAEYLITDLAKFTRYSIVVQAVNQVGPGPLSEPVTAQTLEDVPSWPPEDIRCVAPSSSPHSLQVSWKPPPIQHCNGILQAYKLQYDSQDEGFDDFDAKKTSSLTLLLSNLHKYTNYSIQVLAMTRVGEGVYSEPIYCQTSEDAPGSPEDIKAVVSSPESLLVTWLAPKEPNGVITKYNLYTRTMTGREELAHKKTSLMSQHLSYEVKNLNEHVEYQFWITASTKVGEGQSSKVISQIPTSRVPAKISSFGGLVRRPWRSTVSLSCLMVGLPLPRRTWLRGDSVVVGGVGGGRNIQIGEGGDLIIGNLQASESDNYTCLVENNMGSDKITYVLLVQVVPSAPILYVASATSSSILLHWRVADDGGSPISGYLLSYKKSNGDLQQSVLHRKTVNYELKGLTCGSTYHISLLARNKLGPSHPSSPIAVRTQGQYPGTPSRDAFLMPNSTSVGLKLHVWPDNGCKLIHFGVKYRPVNDIDWIVVSNSLKPQRRFTISNLLPATEYQLQIEAFNVAGSSTGDYQFSTLTKDGELPPPDSIMRGRISSALLLELKFLLPAVGVLILLLSVIVALCAICRRLRSGRRRAKETEDNEQNLEAQRERYYATMQKVPLHDKIPETSEEISPYATFQLEPPALLHSFRYQDDSVMPGCASTPPMSMSKIRRRRRSSGRKTDVDSEDSEESDHDPLTSSRTESSNHLDKKHHDNRFIYHGAQSSTSSDISPMTEQKSLPRRGHKSRWLATPSRSGNLRAPHMALAETPGPFRNGPELSEAECDIDTLKKLKLGLRSSLWSKPAGSQNPQSDYSIAV
ncbi:hypothetical protein M8J75_016027 [Diaphorina citri]|nr:hypothetical protein M8J75_016027 [Diaphorina citri]KAI5735005.1 hypothetical protein M8J77_013062 [Diaphorina citri]